MKIYGPIFFDSNGVRSPTFWENIDELIKTLVDEQQSHKIVSRTDKEAILESRKDGHISKFYVLSITEGFKAWMAADCPKHTTADPDMSPLPVYTRGVVFNLIKSFSEDM